MLTAGTTAIGTAATMIDGNSIMPLRLTIHNNDNTDAVYLGGSAVTTTVGFKMDKGVFFEIILNPLEQLYAVSTKAGHIISWIRQTL